MQISRRAFFQTTAIASSLVAHARTGDVAGAQSPARPRVWVFATGGTIAAVGSSPTDLSNYKSGTLLAEQLLASVPQVRQYTNVHVEQVVNIGSYDLTVADWLRIANRINEIFATDSLRQPASS